MKLTEGVKYIIKKLQPVYSEREAGSIARLLLEQLGYDSGPTAIIQNKHLDKLEISQLDIWIKKLHQNEPIQYILGYTWFLERKVFVNEHCLIPRQETEELVLEILKNTNQKFNKNILDIGTGSGCIALSLAKVLESANIFASDISKAAIEVAERNSFIYNTELSFIQDDILCPDYEKYPEFDLIVSNPPYVRELEKEKMQSNVLDFEPETALFVPDNDPLLYYRAIIDFSHIKLVKDGELYFEINEAFGDETVDLLQNNGFTNIELKKDIHDKNRIIKAQKK